MDKTKFALVPRYQDNEGGYWYTDFDCVDFYSESKNAVKEAINLVDENTGRNHRYVVTVYEMKEITTVEDETKDGEKSAHPVLGC